MWLLGAGKVKLGQGAGLEVGRAASPGVSELGTEVGPLGSFWTAEQLFVCAPSVRVWLTHLAQLRRGSLSWGASFGEREDWLRSATMKVKVIPVLEDNYMYLIIEEQTREAVAVDVAVSKRVRADQTYHQGTPGADPTP